MTSFEIARSIFRGRLWMLAFIAIAVLSVGIVNVFIIDKISSWISSQQDTQPETFTFIGLLILVFVTGTLSQFTLETIGHSIIHKLRQLFIRQLMQSTYDKLLDVKLSNILNVFSIDMNVVRSAVFNIPPALANTGLIIACVIYMFFLSPILAGMVLTILSIALLIGTLLVKKAHNIYWQERDVNELLMSGCTDLVKGQREILLNENRGENIYSSLIEMSSQTNKLLRSAGLIHTVQTNFTSTLALAAVVSSLLVVHLTAFSELKTGIAIAITTLFIRAPLNAVSHQIPAIYRSMIAFNKIASFNFQAPQDRNLNTPDKQPWQKIKLENLAYRYPGNEHFNLGPINLEIEKGDICFIIGKNGSGKTTLTNLLAGLLCDFEGKLSLDDTDINKENIRSYRSMFSAVLSDFHLFDKILGEHGEIININEYKNLVNKLELKHVVSENGKILNTKELSTGQRKRLALLIASAEKRDILLLDEWAADQDPIFREKFYREILPSLKRQGVTCIVVSHDDRYFDVADRVISLQDGSVKSVILHNN